MLELTFTLCLMDSDVCEPYSLQFVEVTPIQCMLGGQQQIAKFMSDNDMLGTWERKGQYTCRILPEGERSI